MEYHRKACTFSSIHYTNPHHTVRHQDGKPQKAGRQDRYPRSLRGAGAAHQNDDVTTVQFGVGTGGEDHRLAPADGHDGAAGGLPELQFADALDGRT